MHSCCDQSLSCIRSQVGWEREIGIDGTDPARGGGGRSSRSSSSSSCCYFNAMVKTEQGVVHDRRVSSSLGADSTTTATTKAAITATTSATATATTTTQHKLGQPLRGDPFVIDQTSSSSSSSSSSNDKDPIQADTISSHSPQTFPVESSITDNNLERPDPVERQELSPRCHHPHFPPATTSTTLIFSPSPPSPGLAQQKQRLADSNSSCPLHPQPSVSSPTLPAEDQDHTQPHFSLDRDPVLFPDHQTSLSSSPEQNQFCSLPHHGCPLSAATLDDKPPVRPRPALHPADFQGGNGEAQPCQAGMALGGWRKGGGEFSTYKGMSYGVGRMTRLLRAFAARHP
ncbi:hypothetical protein IE53DRAFT_52358 [Violaceomyces palustris]|uniref:Uncharacterized protein n=1 Tax=Violaceomyces palustris TaxID=1673888 RepID=A0ACD0NZX6_9BASI|nr:hypothetical protein IE53DRAFT_52358 [Violaceomyces palustris]